MAWGVRWASIIGYLIFACVPRPVPSAKATGGAEQNAHVNGTDLRFLERGSGPAVVFVHGSMGDLTDFEQQASAFAVRYRTIAYSRRYHPPNAPPAADAEYAMAVHAADLSALLRSLHADPAVVVASSYGAYTSLFLAVHHPGSVRALVLGEPPLLPWLQESVEGRKVLASFRSNVWDPARAAFLRGDEEGGLRAFVDGVTGKPGSFDAMPPPLHAAILSSGPEMSRELLTPFERYMPLVTCEEVSGLRVPILLVEGEKSPELFHLITEQLARCAGNAQRVTVPNAGHAMHRSNASFYDAAVSKFLDAGGL